MKVIIMTDIEGISLVDSIDMIDETKDGYRFAIGSESIALRTHTKAINEGIGGRGGGSDSLLQGSASKTAEEIKAFLGFWLTSVCEA